MYRPIYHFLPEKNWMNDPNGVCWFQGYYHLFYQYNPNGSEWGNIHWGHAVSRDCIRWKHLPIALFPSRDAGEIHCFSGCVSVDENQPVLYYTSVGEEEEGRDCHDGAQQWCAVSTDGMITWKKYENNPILTKDMHGQIKVRDWRDPFVWREKDGWYMVLGAETDGRAGVLLYRSEDRFDWKFVKVLIRSEREEERIWECPNYFKLGDKAVLAVSPNAAPRYIYGREEEGHVFVPEGDGVLDHSGWDGFYAPNSFEDCHGRRIMIGWLTENGRGELKVPEWSGIQSLPRQLTMEPDGLHMCPIEEVASLRGNCERYVQLSGESLWKAQTRGKALEICVEFYKNNVEGLLEIQVFASPDQEEKTRIIWEKERDMICIDRQYSNHTGKTSQKLLSCPAAECEKGKVSLDIFLDYSSVEVFVSGKQVISTRVYPGREDSDGVCLYGREYQIEKLEIFEMKRAMAEEEA